MRSPRPALAAYKRPQAVEDNAIDGLCRPQFAKAEAAAEDDEREDPATLKQQQAWRRRRERDRGRSRRTSIWSGKSCRLRWVNYLHPDLKHGRMSPQEELLVLQLHAKWGNRWSRIARCLPGRTDNEIKNYWRTHMRKKAEERSMNAMSMSSCSPPSSPSSSSSHGSSSANYDPKQEMEIAGLEGVKEVYSMDQIWDEIAADSSTTEEHKDGAWCVPAGWGEWSQSQWKEGDKEEFEMMMPAPLTDDLSIGNTHAV